MIYKIPYAYGRIIQIIYQKDSADQPTQKTSSDTRSLSLDGPVEKGIPPGETLVADTCAVEHK